MSPASDESCQPPLLPAMLVGLAVATCGALLLRFRGPASLTPAE
jgi:hypothetical protein